MSSMAEITKYCLWSPVTWGSDVPLFRVVAGDRNHRNLFLECDVFLFLKEIPPDLVYDIDRDCANTFLKFLLEKQKWPEVLLLLTRKVSGQPPLGDCLIKDCDLSTLDLCAILPHLKAWDQRRTLDAEAGVWPAGLISQDSSLHPATRVGDFQRLSDWTHHQEWSEGTRARAQGGHGASSHLRPAGLWRLPWQWLSPAVGQGCFAAAAAAVCECE